MPDRLLRLFSLGPHTMERITDIIAVISIATWVNPAVFEYIRSVSEMAGLLMPIFGVSWLGVQIWHKITRDK